MAGFTIRVKNAAEVAEKLDHLYYQVIFPKVDRAVQKAGRNCQKYAKLAAPVDTGRLRASIQYQPYILQAIVSTNVKYAPFVEHGHYTHSGSYVAAKPFLYPAYQRAAQELIVDLRKIAANPIKVVIEEA